MLFLKSKQPGQRGLGAHSHASGQAAPAPSQLGTANPWLHQAVGKAALSLAAVSGERFVLLQFMRGWQAGGWTRGAWPARCRVGGTPYAPSYAHVGKGVQRSRSEEQDSISRGLMLAAACEIPQRVSRLSPACTLGHVRAPSSLWDCPSISDSYPQPASLLLTARPALEQALEHLSWTLCWGDAAWKVLLTFAPCTNSQRRVGSSGAGRSRTGCKWASDSPQVKCRCHQEEDSWITALA